MDLNFNLKSNVERRYSSTYSRFTSLLWVNIDTICGEWARGWLYDLFVYLQYTHKNRWNRFGGLRTQSMARDLYNIKYWHLYILFLLENAVNRFGCKTSIPKCFWATKIKVITRKLQSLISLRYRTQRQFIDLVNI